VTTSAPFDRHLEQVSAGETLPAEALRALAGSHDILGLGMLADTLRRRIHGTQTTYLRVAGCAIGAPCEVPAAAREIRIGGMPASLEAAVRAVAAAASAAGGRTVSAFSWTTIEQLAAGEAHGVTGVLAALRDAGLDALAALPLDTDADPRAAVEALGAAGFRQLRLTLGQGAASDRLARALRAASLQAEYGIVQALDPLTAASHGGAPATGYDDVRMVALARLAAPGIPTIQVDWARYGPKLAQVVLTVGADDLDGVSASDEAPEGRRRAPLEEVRRNIEAAGFEPRERDGRFARVG
jgi:hypothetical protein